MGFKRTSEGRVFFQSGGLGDEGNRPSKKQNGVKQDNVPQTRAPVQPASAPLSASQSAPAASSNPMQMQILSLLKSLNERLHASQSEREYLRGELETYKGLVQDLRHKAEGQENAYKQLEKKIEESAQASKKSVTSERLAKETFKELEETRKVLAELEEKSDKTEHELKLQISQIRQSESTIKKKQIELENLQAVQQADIAEKIDSRQKHLVISQNKRWEELLSKMDARQKEMDTRITLAEQTTQSYDDKIEEALSQTSKLERKIDKATQDRVRFIRKLERIEETVIQTHDALNSQAMVLLTDRNLAAQGNYPHSPATGGEIEPGALPPAQDQQGHMPNIWWKKPLPLNAVTGSALLVVTLLAGWLVSNVQRPDFSGFTLPEIEMPELPEIAITQDQAPETEYQSYDHADMELDFLAEDPVNLEEAMIETGEQEIMALSAPIEPDAESPELDAPVSEEETEIDSVLDGFIEEGLGAADDIGTQSLTEKEKILEILENNPDQVAAKLNDIEPGAAPIKARKQPEPLDITEKTAPAPEKKEPARPPFDYSVSERITPDPNLPSNIKEIENQAFDGSAEAQHDLAAIYTAGHGGVRQNYDRAAKWFQEASRNGIANASYNLGVLYHQGIGVNADLTEAISWYQAAADRNHPEAQYNLGIACIEGIGMAYDPEKAAGYFKSAADSGIMEAAYNLGLIYENGLLGQSQPDKALMWYKTAADQGSPEAKAALEQLARSLSIQLDEVNKIVENMKKEQGAG